MSVLADPTTVSPLVRARWAMSDALAVARRNLTHVRHVPEKLIDVTLQPLMFVALFAYVFGNAIHVPGGDYREYLMAGIFVQTLAFGVMGTAVGMAEDITKGVVDRFRSLPMARSAVLSGRTSADVVYNAGILVILMLSGLVVGWRVHGTVGDFVLAIVLMLAFTFAMAWIGVLLGLLVKTVENAQQLGFLVIFPLTFVSSAFVPVQTLPGVLKPIAEWNPVSALVSATRDLFGNPNPYPSDSWPGEHALLLSFVWIIGLLIVFAPLAVRRYRSIER